MTLYVSGPEARELEQLTTPGITVHFMSERSGDASAIKMCYAAMTKGVQALVLELLISARRLGVDAALEAQIKASRSDVYNFVIDALPRMPPKAYRWVPETEEIAATFAAAGLTPLGMQGAAQPVAEAALFARFGHLSGFKMLAGHVEALTLLSSGRPLLLLPAQVKVR